MLPWDLFKLFDLVEIMRQKDDLAFAQLLNVIRSKPNNETLSEEQLQLLKSRVCKNSPKDIIHIFPRNAEVDMHNDTMISTLDSQILTITAADFITTNAGLKKRKAPAVKPGLSLFSEIKVGVGARIMVITNVDVSDGLCNGVMGTVIAIKKGKMEYGLPDGFWIIFDNNKIGKNRRMLQPPPSNISPQCVFVTKHMENFTFEGKKIIRHQFPLRLAWGCTIHKTQGMTVDKGVVSLQNIFLPGMGYVALSRIRKLEGLYISDWNEKALYCDGRVSESLQNMERLEIKAAPLLQVNEKDDQTIFICHNVRSLRANYLDVKCNPEMLKADFLCFCETWLTVNDANDDFQIDGYKLLRCDRPDNSGRGGVAIYVKNHIVIGTPLCMTTVHGLEIMSLTTSIANICVIYRSPKVTFIQLDTEIAQLLSHIESTQPCIVLGDFNVNLIAKPTDILLPSLQHFHQVIKEVTYYDCSGSGSLLDHIYHTNCDVVSSGVLQTYFSDHYPVYMLARLNMRSAVV